MRSSDCFSAMGSGRLSLGALVCASPNEAWDLDGVAVAAAIGTVNVAPSPVASARLSSPDVVLRTRSSCWWFPVGAADEVTARRHCG